VVYPNADLKVYLDASVERRAERRRDQLGEGAPSLDELKQDIETRDARDRGRAVGPLVRVADAVYLDTSALSLDEVVDALVAIAVEVGSGT
jgi:cytidylate kinase